MALITKRLHATVEVHRVGIVMGHTQITHLPPSAFFATPPVHGARPLQRRASQPNLSTVSTGTDCDIYVSPEEKRTLRRCQSGPNLAPPTVAPFTPKAPWRFRNIDVVLWCGMLGGTIICVAPAILALLGFATVPLAACAVGIVVLFLVSALYIVWREHTREQAAAREALQRRGQVTR